jgi:hypothetical protein
MNMLMHFIILKLTEIRLKKCKSEAEIPVAMCEMAELFEKHAKILRAMATKV